MENTIYLPIIKTIDAEIKGYGFLTEKVKKSTLPIFELTRSRPIKNFPEGDIHRRMDQIGTIQKNLPFILDLCSHPDLINKQIEDLYDDSNGFQEWRQFLEAYKNLNIIPSLHLYPDDLTSYISLAQHFSTRYEKVAFRVSIDETNARQLTNYITKIKSIINLENQYHLILDAGYVFEANIKTKTSTLQLLASAAMIAGVKSISINSSSFPKSALDRSGGGDEEGKFKILEVSVFKDIKGHFMNAPAENVTIHYGDYGSIHPLRTVVKGGSWVPRIDVSLDENYIYKRFRRDDGGYAEAAREMVRWSEYDPVDCWGKDKIDTAAAVEPEGRSPSFWIAVRLNQHVSRFSKFHKSFSR